MRPLVAVGALALTGCAGLPDVRDELPNTTDRCVVRMSELAGAAHGETRQFAIFGGEGQAKSCQMTILGECPPSMVAIMKSAKFEAGACVLELEPGTFTPEDAEALRDGRRTPSR